VGWLAFGLAASRGPPAQGDRGLGPNDSPSLFRPFPVSKIGYSFKYFRNPFKLPKFVENHRNIRKIQNKFSMNPPEQIYAVD
jgi:hypothetical protein